jgi:hypothetical protein
MTGRQWGCLSRGLGFGVIDIAGSLDSEVLKSLYGHGHRRWAEEYE